MQPIYNKYMRFLVLNKLTNTRLIMVDIAIDRLRPQIENETKSIEARNHFITNGNPFAEPLKKTIDIEILCEIPDGTDAETIKKLTTKNTKGHYELDAVTTDETPTPKTATGGKFTKKTK